MAYIKINSGYIVTLRDKSKYLAVHFDGMIHLLNLKDQSHCTFTDDVYDRETGFHRNKGIYDIMRVEKPTGQIHFLSTSEHFLHTIWKRSKEDLYICIKMNGVDVDPTSISEETWAALREVSKEKGK